MEANNAASNPQSLIVERTIGAYGRLSDSIENLFQIGGSPLVTGYLQWQVIGETQGLIGVLEFGTEGGSIQTAVTSQSDGYSDVYFSYSAEAPGFYTGVALWNPNGSPSTLRLERFDTDGKSPGAVIFTLQPGQRRARLLDELFPPAGLR